MSERDRIFRRGATVVGLLAAALIGYVAARLTQPSPATPVVAPAKATLASNTLSIPDSSLATMGIALETVGAAASLGNEVQASAVVAPAPNGQAVVTARAPGTVTRLEKMLGQNVAAGEVLALVESRDAAAMAAERTTAESKVSLARSNVARERSLFEQKVTPRQGLETAEADLAAAEAEAGRARAAASAAGVTADGRSLALKSPIAGRITVVNAALGAYVEPDMELFRIADPRFVVIEAAVPPLDARRVEIGDGAEIATGSGAKLRATVSAVTPTLNERTRAATVTLSLADGQTAPAPGEFVLARISTRSGDANGFVVPDEAVQILDGRNVVFVRSDGEFRATPVVVSSRTGGRAAIASGLKTGDVIATTNAFLLKAELGKGADEEE